MRRVRTRKGCVLGVPLVLGGALGIGGALFRSRRPLKSLKSAPCIKEVEALRVGEKSIEPKTAPISEFEDATLYADSEGRARLYIESLGGTGFGGDRERLFRSVGERLRFVFCRAGAVNETILGTPLLPGDKNGKTLKKNIALVQGAGYPWDWATVEKEVVFGRARSPKESFGRFEGGGTKETWRRRAP
jgi:hypothetical protein